MLFADTPTDPNYGLIIGGIAVLTALLAVLYGFVRWLDNRKRRLATEDLLTRAEESKNQAKRDQADAERKAELIEHERTQFEYILSTLRTEHERLKGDLTRSGTRLDTLQAEHVTCREECAALKQANLWLERHGKEQRDEIVRLNQRLAGLEKT